MRLQRLPPRRLATSGAALVRFALAAVGLALLPAFAGVGRAGEVACEAPREELAPGPRQSELIGKRKAKALRLQPYRPTWLERTLLAYEKAERPAIDEINLWGAYPRVQAIDQRSQWAAGARLWRPDLAGSPLDVAGAAFWSFHGFRYLDAQLGLLPHRGDSMPLLASRTDDVFELPSVRLDDDRRLMLYGAYGQRRAPRFAYWGLGIDAEADAGASFRQADSLYELVAGYRAKRWLTLGARAGYYTVALGPGEDDELPSIETRYTVATAPGLAAQPDFWRLASWAVIDTRDVAGNPHRGALAAALWMRFDDRNDGSESFDRLAADGRLYLPLGHRQRVLALRTYFSQDIPGSGARVPFYLQASLGGGRTLRAYDSQRFRGQRLLLLQAEYRVEAAPALELALFADAGTAAAEHDERLGKLRTDGGIGLRFKSHETVLVRVDAAWGGEGFRLRLRFSPVF